MSRTAVRTCAVAVAGAVLLAACSSSSAGGTTGQVPAGAAPSGGSFRGGTGTGGGFGPRAAASGEIAQISGATLQVQSTSAQTAVTYTAKTAFTITKSTDRSAVKVGACVVATSATASSGSTIKADSVRVSPARNGQCTAGGPGGGFAGRPGGGFPSGAPTGAVPGGLPSGAPSGFPGGTRPSGAPGGFGGQGAFAAGKVTKLSGSTLTVAMSRGGSAASTRTVTLGSATKYTATVGTNHSSAKVGLCAVAQGKTATNGTVTATSIALSSKTGGSCAAGFGGPRG